MQKFFVVSLFLMFSCYGAEEPGITTEPLKKKPQAVIRPIPKRPDLSSKSTTDLWSNLKQQEIAEIQARAAAETAKSAEMAIVHRIVEKDPKSWGPNCGGKGTFKRKQLKTETTEENNGKKDLNAL
ncbi:MAG: hypothetical protein EBU90_16285 [Proteobacteria bacterium]|nr:hypothetical protein [Pseudomonadota bacterium]